jgi:surface polysaccharide O-acyltransferase-like enzyme
MFYIYGYKHGKVDQKKKKKRLKMSPPLSSSVNVLYLIIIIIIIIIYYSTFGGFNTNWIICKNVEILRKKK